MASMVGDQSPIWQFEKSIILQHDSAYHRATVWGWLIGPYVIAHLRVYNDPELARSYLYPLIRQLTSHGLGNISEIFEREAPFTPRGCISQAWSVAEVLHAWLQIGETLHSHN